MNSEGLELERVRVRCPACGELLEAVARDGVIRGWCSISRQRVNFLIETQRGIGKNPTVETSPVKDGVVSDYMGGVKIIVIQLKHGISPSKMYRILHASPHVKLRTSQEAKQQ